MCRFFLANQQTINNEYSHYTQSNLSTDNVPLSAHKNNYLIKLIILLNKNKTGRLPEPANFPNIISIILVVLTCRFSANMKKMFSSYTNTRYYTLTNIIWITAILAETMYCMYCVCDTRTSDSWWTLARVVRKVRIQPWLKHCNCTI